MAERIMTDEHKAAIAAGRVEATAVREYLEALEAAKPKHGRRANPDQLNAKRSDLTERLGSGEFGALQRLQTMQEIEDIDNRLAAFENEPDRAAVEGAFVEHARSYASRKEIQYTTWRKFGVPADVLSKAGIARGS